jgi:hypothetical protein
MKKTLYLFIAIISALIFLTWGGFRIVNNVQFDRNCEGFLKRSADANTIEIAKQQLKIAVDYCEDAGLTSGYTSIWYTTPDEEVGFWYQNLKSSLAGLYKIPADANDLLTSNVLMKLRETLLDDTDTGTSVTCPSGISIYPYNTAYMWWGIISGLLTILFGIGAIRYWND